MYLHNVKFDLKYHDLFQLGKQKGKVLIVQPKWLPTQISRDSNQVFRLNLYQEDISFIDQILEKGVQDEADLIVFPEFSIPEPYLTKVQNWSTDNDCVVVAGSTYKQRDGKHYNTASVFYGGIMYETEKQKLSPHETSKISGYGPSGGNEFYYLKNTPLGTLAVLICADEFDRHIRNDVLDIEPDILCVIACQSKAKEHHQSIDRIVKESNKGIYVVYSNALCEGEFDGRSAFFGNNYKDGFDEYRDIYVTVDDGIDQRAVEMPASGGCLVVEYNLQDSKATFPNLDPDRSLINIHLPFVFENRKLRQLSIAELKKSKRKPAKQYQPSIPPVKTFKSKYIGRSTDIKYLNDFFSDSDKHFLMLHGVGGMGKSHLLYECIKTYHGTTFIYHAVSRNEDFSLDKLFEICTLIKPADDLSVAEKQQLFIKEFQKNEVYMILDDYYEVKSNEVLSMLPELTGIGAGKLLIITRVVPSRVNHMRDDFTSHRIDPLDEDDFAQVIQNYILSRDIKLSEAEVHTIFEKAQGYPLGGQLIIDALPYAESLDELLADLGKFEAQLDPDGVDYSGRLLDRIFTRGKPEEIQLLCEFSALFGPSDISTIQQLPSYSIPVFEGLYKRKGFVDRDTSGHFSSHAMIKDFAYYRLNNSIDIHRQFAGYFENKIVGRTDNDWIWLREAVLHYSKVGGVELDKFKKRIEIKFESRNIKGFVEDSIDSTIRNYQTLTYVFPNKPAYYNELGMAYKANRQHTKAIETFERALAVEWDNVRVLNELGITYRENGQLTKAIETFERALAVEWDNVRVLNELGITYREHRQLTKAIETFERALAIDPEHLPSLNELGITYREHRQLTKAIETFERALAIDPEHLPSLNELGITYREHRQLTKAIETFERALAVEWDNVRVLNELGITYRENGQLTKAIETFERALAVEWDNVRVLNELGITYREHRQLTKAIETFERALAVEWDNVRVLNELGITYRENGQLTKAIETFERALSVEPENVRVLNELGITYRENGKIDEAIEVCLRASRISGQKQPHLNLLQIYLLFRPDVNIAQLYYDILIERPRLKAFNSSRKKYLTIMENLEPLWSCTMTEVAEYEALLFLAIQYHAYTQVLPLLEKMDVMFPGNSKIKSRLGKTLCNETIAEHEKGRIYLKEAIRLFQVENNNAQVKGHIFYYYFNLLRSEEFDLLDEEMERYVSLIPQDADYLRFMAHYNYAKSKNIAEVVVFFEKAIEIAEGPEQKHEMAESLLRFLSNQSDPSYRIYYSKYEYLL
jgi:tetratricopeptide (TPR) repeat protein/predicted amidohydrolase